MSKSGVTSPYITRLKEIQGVSAWCHKSQCHQAQRDPTCQSLGRPDPISPGSKRSKVSVSGVTSPYVTRLKEIQGVSVWSHRSLYHQAQRDPRCQCLVSQVPVSPGSKRSKVSVSGVTGPCITRLKEIQGVSVWCHRSLYHQAQTDPRCECLV